MLNRAPLPILSCLRALVGAWLLLAGSATIAFAATVTSSEGTLAVWYPLTIDFDGPGASERDNSPNPFLDYRLTVILTSPSGDTVRVPGFFAGNGEGGSSGRVWRARFSADEAGQWSYRADFRSGNDVAISLNNNAGSTTAFHGESGTFQVQPRVADAPGFLSKGRLEYTGEHYLKFRDGGYWIKSGTDSPENFLGYKGFDDTVDAGGRGRNFLHEYGPHRQHARDDDPYFVNRSSGEDSLGITGALNYLSEQGVNSIYFLPMNLGGDGQETFPFVGNSKTGFNKTHYDVSKLYQWNLVLNHAQRRGIALNIVLSETEEGNEKWFDNGNVGDERKLYLRELVARFGYLLGAKWNIGEEADFINTNKQKAMAQYIAALDWSEKPITVHTRLNNLGTYPPLYGDNRFSASSIQYSPSNAGKFVEEVRSRSAKAGRRWVIDMDENAPAQVGLTDDNAEELRREVLYDVYFSGGNIEWYLGYHPNGLGGDLTLENFATRKDMWNYMRIAREWMEAHLPFWDMQPNDGLLSGETSRFGGGEVFALPGKVYAVYLPDTPSGQLNLSGHSGRFDITWYNPKNGKKTGNTRSVQGGSRVSLGSAPSGASDDWIVLVAAEGFRVDRPQITQADDPVPAAIEPEQQPEQQPEPQPEPQPEQQQQPESQPTEETVVPPVSANTAPDDAEQVIATLDITPAPNQPPSIVGLSDQEVMVGETIRLTVSASDPDGVVPSLFAQQSPSASRLLDNGDGTRRFEWTPTASDTGEHVVTVVAQDGRDTALTDTESFTVTVSSPPPSAVPDSPTPVNPTPATEAPVNTAQPVVDPAPTAPQSILSDDLIVPLNLPPIIVPIENQTVPVGQAIQLQLLPVDPEGIAPGLVALAIPGGAVLIDNLNGTRTMLWTPDQTQLGVHTLTFQATDALDQILTSTLSVELDVVVGGGADDTANASRLVVSDNQKPFFVPVSDASVQVGQRVSFRVKPVDPEGIAPSLQIMNAPRGAMFGDNGDGSRQFVWTPTESQSGTHFVTFVATDHTDTTLTTSLRVTIAVNPQ